VISLMSDMHVLTAETGAAQKILELSINFVPTSRLRRWWRRLMRPDLQHLFFR